MEYCRTRSHSQFLSLYLSTYRDIQVSLAMPLSRTPTWRAVMCPVLLPSSPRSVHPSGTLRRRLFERSLCLCSRTRIFTLWGRKSFRVTFILSSSPEYHEANICVRAVRTLLSLSHLSLLSLPSSSTVIGTDFLPYLRIQNDFWGFAGLC